ncbi:MAG: hypothetical protein ACOY0T_12825 [Myxococcota bacterium]
MGAGSFLEPARDDTSQTLLVNKTIGQIRVEVAVRWRVHRPPRVESFANVTRTTDGGTHVRGLVRGLTKGLRLAAPQTCRQKTSKQLLEAIYPGLDAVVCVSLKDPTYDSPTKDKLSTPAAEAAVVAAVCEAFVVFARDEKPLLRRFVSRLRRQG